MPVKPPPFLTAFHKAQAEDALPAKSVTDIITNGFFSVDEQWTVKVWNAAAEKLLWRQAKDIVGKNLWEELAGILPLDFYEVYHKAFVQDVPIHFHEYWAEMGAWFDVVAYHSDQTLSVSFKNSNYQTDPQQQLKTMHELYEFVTSITNDCLWEWDISHKQMFWIDGGHKRVFGYPIENALIPQAFWEHRVHPDDLDRVLTRLQAQLALGTDAFWDEEYQFQRSSGEYAYVHDRGHIIYASDKTPLRIIGATQDITARKLAANRLFESERKLSLIARQTVNAVAITDAQERIIWVNNAFMRITEYTAEEVMGRKLASFLHGPETDPATVAYMQERIKSQQPYDCKMINYAKSGRKYWIQVQGQALFDEQGNCEQYFAIQTDITEKISMENVLVQERLDRQKEITSAVLTAQENERAEIGREMHDNLNQVLGAAKLYIELAKTDDEKRPMCLEKSSGYILDVIQQIRRISKTLITPGMVMGLTESIHIILDDLLRTHPITVDFEHVGIDEHLVNEKLQLNIFRIVQEQFNNILKHAAATSVTVYLTQTEHDITLLISDNGVGCDLRQEREGVGITNIEGRTEMCGGSLELESAPGAGYRLKVVLPLTEKKRVLE